MQVSERSITNINLEVNFDNGPKEDSAEDLREYMQTCLSDYVKRRQK